VHEVLLQLDLPLDRFELLGLVLVDGDYLHGHDFSGELVDGLLDLAKPPLADCLIWVIQGVLSS
jgi:hypothetical protein